MRRFAFSLRSSWIGPCAAAAFFCSLQAHAVVISQVYGGGGNSGATYANDFVELFNDSATAVDLNGWSLQYTSAAGSSWQTTVLAGLIAPYGYYLVAEDAGASGDGSPLPTADLTGSINLSASNGKVALVGGSDAPSGTCPGDPLLDLVGYGTANCFEGSAAAGALSSTLAALRMDGGLIDTGENVDDFAIATPTPRNSAAPAHLPRLDPGVDGEVLPEPPTALLALAGLVALLAQRRRGRSRSNVSGMAGSLPRAC